MVSNATPSFPVHGPPGLSGVLHELPAPDGDALIELADGRKLRLPARLLRREGDAFHLALSPEQTHELHDKLGLSAVPIIQEQARIDTQRREGDTTVVHVVPTVARENVDVPVAIEEVDVQRVPINRVVTEAQPVRTEGDVTIVPVYEEVLVVEKRLMLKEEVRITRRRSTVTEHREVELRREEVHVLKANAEKSNPSAQ